MKHRISLVVGLALFISSLCHAQSSGADMNFRNTLENTWRNYLQACKSGKESELVQTISAFRLATMKNNLANSRRSLTPEIIMSISEDAEDISAARFVTLLEKGPTAALVYVKDAQWQDATGKPRVEFVLLKFVKEEAGWKVDGVLTAGSYKYMEDGKEMAFDAASIVPPFSIDGQVPVAPKAIAIPDVAGYLDVDSYGYKTQVTINGVEQKTTVNESSTRLISGGMRKGANSIAMQFTQIEKEPTFRLSVKIRRILADQMLAECFSYEPKDNIEGSHTLGFTIRE